MYGVYLVSGSEEAVICVLSPACMQAVFYMWSGLLDM